MAKKEWEKQAKEMESIVEVVEGGDERNYDADEISKKEL